mgnify:FL=1
MFRLFRLSNCSASSVQIGRRLFGISQSGGFENKELNQPVNVHGKPLPHYDAVHEQFIRRRIREGIDNDERDIGAYPLINTNYRERDYRQDWDDKFNRRMYNEPVPEQFDADNVFMVDQAPVKMWVMVTSVFGFLSLFGIYLYLHDKYLQWTGQKIKKHPFQHPRYTLRSDRH